MIANKGITAPDIFFAISSLQDEGLFRNNKEDGREEKMLMENWAGWLTDQGLQVSNIRLMEQPHGTDIQTIESGQGEVFATVPGVDGLTTDVRGVFLGVQTADCLPLLFFSEEPKAVAVAHAGWRGLVAGIIEKTISELKQDFGVLSSDISVIVGPGIGPCCYDISEIDKDRLKSFQSYAPDAITEDKNSRAFDLRKATQLDLESKGVASEKMYHIDDCTSCGVMDYPSFRKNATKQRLMSYIGIR